MFLLNPKTGQAARALRRNRLLSTAIVFGLAFSSFAGVAVALPSPGPQQQAAVSFDQQKAVLSQYGQFTALPEYGEVWVPSALPQGWHPYPPCNWVFEKTLGWYYDDKTPWGAIVHHYGRWTNHPQLGWVWVPGQEFSPGWVVWRTSTDWVGWAPLPPDSDLQTISAGDFDTDKDWIFVATKDFGGKCGTQIQATPQIFRDTQVVREVRYVGGIFVPVFPTYIVAPLVIDLHIGWFPWSPGFIGGIFNVWNFIWNNIEINVVVNTCLPKVLPMQKLPVAPINSNPPPPPGGGGKPPLNVPPKLPPRVDNPPPQLPPVVNNPPTRVFTPPPIVVENPPPRVVINNPPPIITPPVIRPPINTPPCFRGRCGGPVVSGNGGGKPIDIGIGNGDTPPKPGRIPPVFGGRGPVFTNVGHQADVGPVSVHPGPVFTGRSAAVGGIGAAGMGAGAGGMHLGGFGGGGFGRLR